MEARRLKVVVWTNWFNLLERRGKLGGTKPHSDSAERPKRAALPPQRGLGDLRLTRQGRRQGFRVKGKLKMEIPEKINLSNRPRTYDHEA